MEGKYRKHSWTPERPEIQPSFQNPSGHEPFQPSQAVFHSLPHVQSEIQSRPSVICTNPGVLGHSVPSTTVCHQGKEYQWSLWKIFLVCLLACVITTTIGVLILSLVKNNNDNPSIVIQLPQSTTGKTTAASKTTTLIATTPKMTTTASKTTTVMATTPKTITTASKTTTIMATTPKTTTTASKTTTITATPSTISGISSETTQPLSQVGPKTTKATMATSSGTEMQTSR
ncbi:dynactin-associated protein-like [Macrotis lagotis]|uniref:dynactin-associated protein-like n=1 Tax=Macrotis lagotis TaxID=92651 RepID=UPI003D68FA33